MWHERHASSNHWWLHDLFNTFLKQTTKKKNTLLGLCEGNPQGGFKHKGSAKPKVFSRHNVTIISCFFYRHEAVPNTRIHQNLALPTGHPVIYAHLFIWISLLSLCYASIDVIYFTVQFLFASPVLRKSSDSLGASKVTLVDNGEIDRKKTTAKYKRCALLLACT